MRTAGFYRELEGSAVTERLVDAVRSVPHDREREIVDRLAAGTPVLVAPEVVEDPLRPGVVLAERAVLTDGRWCWPAVLAPLVRRHHLALPVDLIDHLLRGEDAASRGISDEDRANVRDALRAEGLRGHGSEPTPDPFATLPAHLATLGGAS